MNRAYHYRQWRFIWAITTFAFTAIAAKVPWREAWWPIAEAAVAFGFWAYCDWNR